MDWTCEAERKIIEKMDWVSEKSRFKIPYTTVSGTHDNKIDENRQFGWDDGVSWWTNGFWPGIMWLLYLRTGDQRYVDIARHLPISMDCITIWALYGFRLRWPITGSREIRSRENAA